MGRMPERTRRLAGDEEFDTSSFAGEMLWILYGRAGANSAKQAYLQIERQLLPQAVGRVHGSFQQDGEREAGAIPEGETEGLRRRDHSSSQTGLAAVESDNFIAKGQRGFPCVIRWEAAPDEFGLSLGEVDGTHGRIADLFQDRIAARLSNDSCQYGGGVENDSTHQQLPGGAPQLIRRPG